jgi:ADP-ribosylglycohydrolase
MRVAACGITADTLDEALGLAKQSAAVTHDHPEGIRGAQATAAAIHLSLSGASKADIKQKIEQDFGYDLSTPLDEIRKTYAFEVSCQNSVPQSILAFLEADDFEDALRNAVSLGGDADTMACIAGGIAEAYFGSVPDHIKKRTLAALDDPLRSVVAEFYTRYGDRFARPRLQDLSS